MSKRKEIPFLEEFTITGTAGIGAAFGAWIGWSAVWGYAFFTLLWGGFALGAHIGGRRKT